MVVTAVCQHGVGSGEIYKLVLFGASFCVGVTPSGVYCSVLEGVMRGGVRLLLWKSSISISSLLHTPQVSWKATQSIFRHVWTALLSLALSLTRSLPFSWLSPLKHCPNINICQENGKEEISLSPSPHHSSHFSLSIDCLFRATPYLNCPSIYPLPPPTCPPYLFQSFCLLCLPLSRLPAFSGWLLTPPRCVSRSRYGISLCLASI